MAVSSYSESVGCIGSAQASIFQSGWLKEQTFTPQRTSFLKNCGQSECHIACVACVPCVACCVCSVCTFTASEFLHALQFPGVEALRSVGAWHLAHTGAFWSCGSHAGFLRFAHGASKWRHKITFVKSALNPPLWIHDMYIYIYYMYVTYMLHMYIPSQIIYVFWECCDGTCGQNESFLPRCRAWAVPAARVPPPFQLRFPHVPHTTKLRGIILLVSFSI